MPRLDLGAQPSRLKVFAGKLYRSWATRSLAIGAVATVVDVSIGTLLVVYLGLGTRAGTMIALAIGTTLNFLAHRFIAFREHNPKLADPALKWATMTVVQTLVHGQLVVMLRDWWSVPFVAAKMISDVLVFTVAQLLLVRYVVFKKTT